MSVVMIDQIVRQQEEITKLRQQRDELVVALERCLLDDVDLSSLEMARVALAKIEGEKNHG